MTAKIKHAGTRQYHQAGLIVYGDDDNYTKFDRLADNPPVGSESPAPQPLGEQDDFIFADGLFFRGAGPLPFGREIRPVRELMAFLLAAAR